MPADRGRAEGPGGVTPRGSLLPGAIRLLVLALLGLVFLSPYLWMAAASLKPLDEIFRASLALWPENFAGVENYGKVLARVPVAQYLWNGVIVCGGILFFQLLFAVPAGYALAKLRFPGRDIAFGAVMLGLLVPPHVPALPLYVAFSEIGLLNSYAALIAPFAISVFAIFLFRQFFRALPDELLHAARLDGMGEWSIVWRVILPNAWPAATAFGIFSVVAHWNDLFWPLIVVQGHARATPALGVLQFRSEEAGDDFGAMMAAAVLMTLPLVLAFLLAQRRFVEGIATTGLKG
ncbi:carbohydrate ABC transporter permease [Paracraurococcus ruber]|uniref:Sugar ABC transporter permease n=1 Tax=Paracraurococcus ruber TaxID=77675 RepID=A0ABS1CZI6_9PROT|nr:sugar ABC transporter permease [Paracraurococcus ruber]TDG29197.1 carbohydrate ABC transporter permease [Paracraurococcus ruber]